MSSIKERLEILQAGDVVSTEAAKVAEEAIDRLSRLTEHPLPQNKVEMLVTHLASALTRIKKGEKIEEPPDALVAEVEISQFINDARREIGWIEQQWPKKLPVEEKNFLSIHYVSIFQDILGGDNQ